MGELWHSRTNRILTQGTISTTFEFSSPTKGKAIDWDIVTRFQLNAFEQVWFRIRKEWQNQELLVGIFKLTNSNVRCKTNASLKLNFFYDWRSFPGHPEEKNYTGSYGEKGFVSRNETKLSALSRLWDHPKFYPGKKINDFKIVFPVKR